MNELIIKDNINIEDLIYNIRGKQVMLDSDLAKLYECKGGTKVINQAVSRNKDRFPSDFYFQLTKEEFINLKSQFVTSSLNNYGGVRKLPYAFTEQGVAMLASVLKTEIASRVSVDIMRAFVYMKKYISENLIEQKFINELVIRHDNDIKLLQESFDKLSEKEVKNEIYFNGQIYDSYSKIIDIMKESKKELIIIDAYSDKITLDMISKINVKVIIITSKKRRLSKLDIEKYNKQYNNLKVIYDETFHDRYFIIDRSIIYHSGTSLNYIGYKTFSINKLDDDIVIKSLIDKIIQLLKN